MALQPQLVKLVEKLTELTNKKKIAWETTADEDTFLTSAGRSVVTIAYIGGTGENAGYRIQVLNDEGRIVGEFSDTDETGTITAAGLLNAMNQSVAQQQLGPLYEMARRSALHADEAVADLLASLEKIA